MAARYPRVRAFPLQFLAMMQTGLLLAIFGHSTLYFVTPATIHRSGVVLFLWDLAGVSPRGFRPLCTSRPAPQLFRATRIQACGAWWMGPSRGQGRVGWEDTCPVTFCGSAICLAVTWGHFLMNVSLVYWILGEQA